jgi:hypothetical protein
MTPSSVVFSMLLVAAAKAATAGPWRWELNEKGKTISLEGGKPKFDMSVIRFRRYGMTGAMPEFQVDGLMHPATDFAKVVPGREHHASWFKGIDHPDANYIAAASPDVILRLTAELRKARETIAAHHSGESVTAREFMATLDKDEERAALRDRVGQLEGALRPFADQWKHCSDEWMRDRLKQGGLEDADRREMRAVLRAREALAAGKNGRTTE